LKKLIILAFGICIGVLYGEFMHVTKQLTCSDYITKYSTWRGYVSRSHDETRCFWVEQNYPNRTRQGVPVRD